jgi:hypothetical protein
MLLDLARGSLSIVCTYLNLLINITLITVLAVYIKLVLMFPSARSTKQRAILYYTRCNLDPDHYQAPPSDHLCTIVSFTAWKTIVKHCVVAFLCSFLISSDDAIRDYSPADETRYDVTMSTYRLLEVIKYGRPIFVNFSGCVGDRIQSQSGSNGIFKRVRRVTHTELVNIEAIVPAALKVNCVYHKG